MATGRRLFRLAAIVSVVFALGGVAVATTATAATADQPTDDTQPMIVGGEKTTTKENPFVVALIGSRGRQFCGGSLVAPDKVVTAAHCTAQMKPKQVRVVAGRTTLSTDEGTVAEVTDIWIHPKWSSVGLKYDASVLTLDRKLPYESIALASPKDDDLYAKGAASTVFGWGYTKKWKPSDTLRKVTVPVVADETCAKAYPKGFMAASMVCAGLREGGKDSCAGDSGGPLVGVTAYGTRKLIGIVSWGKGCAEPDKYGVYGRTAAFYDLLEKQIAG